MNGIQQIAEWHEKLLTEALRRRDEDPDFRFSLRTGDITGRNRLQRGYWFPGNDRYLFFPPFRVNDPHNKTKSIGFVIVFNSREQPTRSYLEVVFGSLRHQDLKVVHQEIVEQLGPFEQKGSGDKYQRTYDHEDPLDAFAEFLREDYPRLRAIIEASGQADAFLVNEQDFEVMVERVNQIRSSVQTPGLLGSSADHDASDEDADEPRNIILYGPPGTGKTHWLRTKLSEYTETEGRVSRDEWLQQKVAEFGWRSVIAAAMADLGRPVRVPEIREHPWVVAKSKERRRDSASVQQSIWGYLQAHTPEEVEYVKLSNRRPPFIFTKSEDSYWTLQDDWAEQDPDSTKVKDILEAGPARSGTEVRRYRVVTIHPSYSYEDFVRGIRPVADEETGTTQFKVVDGVFKQICDEARKNPGKRYALFIDEINRANISKVFGELITLIEPDKRAEYDASGRQIRGLSVQLPGGGGTEVAEEPFGVPANLDLYGTMNTADRSIALLDVALRRRFEFREMPPNYDVLDEPVGSVDIGKMLRRINDRLEYLLDRDHRIGHAYFMNVSSLDDLRRVFKLQIIPLLHEYFFDDHGRVALVLATPPGVPPFLAREQLARGTLFPPGAEASVPGQRARYTVTDPESWTEETFLGLYAVSPVGVEQQAIEEPAWAST